MSTQVIDDSILESASTQDVTNLEVLSKYSLLESEQKVKTLKTVFTEYFGTNYLIIILIFLMIVISLVALISLF